MRVMLIQIGDSETREFPIDVDEYVIGRDHSCNLRLDHGRISRNHCRIHLVNGKVLIEALYSAAGTAVNQKVVDPRRPPVEVHDGDHLWVGPEHFQFLIESNTHGPNGPNIGLGSSADVEPMSNPLLKFEPPSNPLVKTTTVTPYRVARPQSQTGRTTSASEKGREPEPAEPEEEPEPLGSLVVTQEDGVVLVRLLQKAIVSDVDIRAITEQLGDLIDAGQNRITLHLGSVERLTSEVLGEVFQVYRRCKAEGGMLKICKVSPQVASVFALTNMQKHIEIFPDERQAMKSAWPRQTPRPAPEPSAPLPVERIAEPVPAPTTRRVQLVVEVGRAKGRTLEINVPRFLIGRDEQCQLRPNSNEISRLHAAIEQRGGRVFVRDLGSQAGTVLNGRVLHDEEAEASDGDRLQIESLHFTFAIETLEASSPPRATAETAGALFGGTSTDPSAATTLMPVQDFTAAASPVVPAAIRSRRRSHLTHQVINEITVVALTIDDLSDESIISAVRSELEAIPFHPVRERRVICFDRVTTFSRGALVMFLARAQYHARNRGTLRFCNVSASIRSYLDTTQLPLMIDIFPTLQEAMAASWDAKEESQQPARSVTL